MLMNISVDRLWPGCIAEAGQRIRCSRRTAQPGCQVLIAQSVLGYQHLIDMLIVPEVEHMLPASIGKSSQWPFSMGSDPAVQNEPHIAVKS
jgi:hypothetical protein